MKHFKKYICLMAISVCFLETFAMHTKPTMQTMVYNTECPICLDPLSFYTRNNFSCGHSMHEDCLAFGKKYVRTCPFCKQPIKIVSTTVVPEKSVKTVSSTCCVHMVLATMGYTYVTGGCPTATVASYLCFLSCLTDISE